MAGMTKEQMAEVRIYKIYKHTLPDGSAYIGMTSEEKDYRRFQYGGAYEKQPFYKAIIELGWSSVKTDILAQVYGTWYEAHITEVNEIQKAVAAGIILYNKDHIKLPKEPAYHLEGCTIMEINQYFPTLKAAAEFIGCTKQAISTALKENRCCKKWTVKYGDQTKGEKENG